MESDCQEGSQNSLVIHDSYFRLVLMNSSCLWVFLSSLHLFYCAKPLLSSKMRCQQLLCHFSSRALWSQWISHSNCVLVNCCHIAHSPIFSHFIFCNDYSSILLLQTFYFLQNSKFQPMSTYVSITYSLHQNCLNACDFRIFRNVI